jgi:hypothetical protein
MAIIYECDNCGLQIRALTFIKNHGGWLKPEDWIEDGPSLFCSKICEDELKENTLLMLGIKDGTPSN